MINFQKINNIFELLIILILFMATPFWIFWAVFIAFVILLAVEFYLLLITSRSIIDKVLWIIAIMVFPPLVIAYIFIYRERGKED